jgi:GNAT superfamily N-acetyltransferase
MSLMSLDHDQFWAGFLGARVSDFDAAGISVRQHVGLAGYRGVWFFSRKSQLVVSAPPTWVEALRESVDRLAGPQGLPSEATVRAVFGPSFDRCVGPAFHGHVDQASFRPALPPHSHALLSSLNDEDAAAIAEFRRACGEDSWRESGLDAAKLYRAAQFETGRIVALAGFRPWSEHAGDPCVVTHPEWRGRGLGTGVVSHVLRAAFDQGKTLLYQTLESNVSSVKLALHLGYQPYARHLAVRLKAEGAMG